MRSLLRKARFFGWLAGICIASISGVCDVAPAAGSTAGPRWAITEAPTPTVLTAGDETGDQAFIVTVVNVGNAPADGEAAPVKVKNQLPAGVTAKTIKAVDAVAGGPLSCETVGDVVTCVDSNKVQPGGALRLEVRVGLSPEAGASAPGTVTVSGGGAPASSVAEPVVVDPSQQIGFGVAPGSTVATTGSRQAGAHANYTTSFSLASAALDNPTVSPRDIELDLPLGLVGNPLAVPQCPMTSLLKNICPSNTAVGVVVASVAHGAAAQAVAWDALVYNIRPNPGEPAAFAFTFQFPIRIDTSVDIRPDGSYGLRASVDSVTEAAQLMGTSVTLWGVPADFNGHGLGFTTFGQTFGSPGSAPRVALMTNPTSCVGAPATSIWMDPWQEPGAFTSPISIPLAPITGCEKLTFDPSISVAPESTQAGAPTGYNINLHIPQNDNPDGLATPALKDATVTLPLGTVLSPSAADGLESCSEDEIKMGTTDPVGCPDPSKIGTAEVDTPLLADPLHGSVYLARQSENPFHSLLAMYLVAEGSGVRIKLAGKIHADPATGQLTTTFANNPQLPFSDLKLHLNGGTRAPLANPRACGEALATSQLTPWSGAAPSTPSSGFTVENCPAPQFAPTFAAGTNSNRAGAFGSFSLTFTRSDSDETLSGLSVHMPSGLLGIIRGIEQCPDAQAAQGACGPGSEVGHVTVGAGPGAHPYFLGGKVFLTGPYKGAPFGLAIAVPAKAGPFDFGMVVVRAAINIDPATAQLTIVSDPLPTILNTATIPIGIPLQIRVVHVDIDRPNFFFNATNCEPLAVGGTLVSTRGSKTDVSARYQAADCQSLAFKPKFTARSTAKTSRANGASLLVKIAYPQSGQANIHSVSVSLPKQLPARLSTIQQACPDATFTVNPAGCPAGSLIGIGQGTTPVLAETLTGPVYLVSHGGAAFPDIVIVLQAQGNIRVDLVGSINISKNGITSSTFASIPDVPISGFQLYLPQGPHSALAAVGSLCAKPLTMPTTITAQNGLQVKQTTKVNVSGCPKKAKSTAKKRRAKKNNPRRARRK